MIEFKIAQTLNNDIKKNLTFEEEVQKLDKVLKEDIEKAYPFTIMSLVKVWKVSLKRYDDKVEKDIQKILDVPALEEISIAEGYFQLFSGNKDYDDYIIENLSK
ncbi:hypothetical protein [Staphylococcus agnetis]|uniref:hypothetical protein n=1 Tax=Staphylococcus agnetis TaxID=985762 RepID=UPI000CD0EE69|nr:hypothetical protein [Staphylococcus agnetis]PNY85032.1 hypothetical protein CD172_09235 [Staphylococcus agnetis]